MNSKRQSLAALTVAVSTTWPLALRFTTMPASSTDVALGLPLWSQTFTPETMMPV